jgi:hypothetical protein
LNMVGNIIDRATHIGSQNVDDIVGRERSQDTIIAVILTLILLGNSLY